MKPYLFIVLLLLVVSSPRRALTREVTLCAASSLREPLQEMTARFEAQAPACTVLLHCAGSSALRRQIEAGGPCDVFIAAGTDDVDALARHGHVHTSVPLAGNELVLFTRRDETACLHWDDLAVQPPRRLAIGDPRTAPVGRYALQALHTAGFLDALRPRLLPCADALHVATAVASGAAAAGLAYRTDLARDTRLGACDVVPPELFPPVTYTLVLLTRGAANPDARQLLEFARSDAARELLGRFGFLPAPPAAPEPVAATPDMAARYDPPRAKQALWLSLRVASAATTLAASLGLALAALLARARPSWPRDLFAACVDLPLVLPPSVLGVVLLELCGARGPLGRIFPGEIAFTAWAAVLASSVVALPLMVRPARSALEAVPSRYVQAARSLGASPWRAFWRVQLPLARRGVLAGVLLAFFRALGEFGATLMVAGNIPGKTQTLPLAIYDAVFLGRSQEALAMVLGVMLLTFAGAFFAQRLHGGKP